MKNLMFLVLLLTAPAGASLWTWTGDLDSGGAVAGSFDYNEAANVAWTVEDGSEFQEGAISNVCLDGDAGSWRMAGAWYGIRNQGEVSFQDAAMTDGLGAGGADFFWAPSRWAIQVWDAAHNPMEFAGRVLSVYRGAYVEPFIDHSDDVAGLPADGGTPLDSNPVPEPSSFILFGSALLLAGATVAFVRRRRRVVTVFGMPE